MLRKPSLYAHIPFCRSRCGYCDFFSTAPAGSRVPDSYVDALLSEAEFYARSYGLEGWGTVYVGGGTPSLLSPAQLERLLSGILGMGRASPPREITVEMNPESLTESHLEVCRALGVTRISLGIQSLNEAPLRAAGRACSAGDALSALETVRRRFSGDLCADIIAGLPCQTDAEFLSSLRRVLDFFPEHVSLYTLTVEDGTAIERKIARGELPWDPDDADRQWILGAEILEGRGIAQYEVSNFSRAGHESAHNLSYWSQSDYVGIGAGACGTEYDFSAKSCGRRFENVRDVRKYTDFWTGGAGEISCVRSEESLSLAVQEFEFLMTGLRTLRGITRGEYGRRFRNLEPWRGDLGMRLGAGSGAWKSFSDRGLCSCEGGDGVFALSRRGLLFLDQLLREL